MCFTKPYILLIHMTKMDGLYILFKHPINNSACYSKPHSTPVMDILFIQMIIPIVIACLDSNGMVLEFKSPNWPHLIFKNLAKHCKIWT